MDQAFELVCTCQEDANSLIKMIGGSTDKDSMAQSVMSTCSELVKIVKTDRKAQREMFVKKLKEANIRALK